MVQALQTSVAKERSVRRSSSVHEAARQMRYERRVLARLNRLGHRIHLWVQAPSHVFHEDGDSIRFLLNEIANQETALLWVAKTARHSEGVVRAKLWLDLEQAIANLEKLELRIMDLHAHSCSVVLAGELSGSVSDAPEAHP
jgi:hypothetical protein